MDSCGEKPVTFITLWNHKCSLLLKSYKPTQSCNNFNEESRNGEKVASLHKNRLLKKNRLHKNRLLSTKEKYFTKEKLRGVLPPNSGKRNTQKGDERGWTSWISIRRFTGDHVWFSVNPSMVLPCVISVPYLNNGHLV